MEKAIKKHLETITVENLMQFRSQAFLSMASTSGKNGTFSLGVNAVGQFVVKANNEAFTFNNPAIAIETYTDLIANP